MLVFSPGLRSYTQDLLQNAMSSRLAYAVLGSVQSGTEEQTRKHERNLFLNKAQSQNLGLAHLDLPFPGH